MRAWINHIEERSLIASLHFFFSLDCVHLFVDFFVIFRHGLFCGICIDDDDVK